jgi:hypothetical protein
MLAVKILRGNLKGSVAHYAAVRRALASLHIPTHAVGELVNKSVVSFPNTRMGFEQ